MQLWGNADCAEGKWKPITTSGGTSAAKQPGHFEVRTSSSQVRSPGVPVHTISGARAVDLPSQVNWPGALWCSATTDTINFIANQQLHGECQIPSETQTDRHQESSLVRFSLKMWHLEGIISTIFPIKKLAKFRVLFGWSRISIHPPNLKFIRSIVLRPPTWWTCLTDITDKRTKRQLDKRTCVFVRLSLRWSMI